MIKTLIFDLGGVFVHIDWYRSVRSLLKELNHYSESQMSDFLQNSELMASYQKGKLSSEEFYSHVCHDLHVQLSYSLFCQIWQDIFLPNEPMIRFLEKIRNQFELVLLSNTNELHIEYLMQAYSFFQYFKHRIYSYKVGLLKPTNSIYEFTLKQIDSSAEECVFIDDTLVNVQAALAMGMKGIHYVSFEDFSVKWKSLMASHLNSDRSF